MDTYGEDTEEYMGSKLDLEEKGQELNKKIDLGCGSGELRTILSNFEAVENWKMGKEIEMKEQVGNQLPTIQEEGGNELWAAISEILDNDGDQSPAPAQQETNKETLENVELGGG